MHPRAQNADDEAVSPVSDRASGPVVRMRDDARRTGGDAWSLERRLPVLISLLVAGVVGWLSFAAYREVRDTAKSRTTERLERVGRELIGSSARSTKERSDTIQALSADAAIVAALAGDGAPAWSAAQIATRLAATRVPADSVLIGWLLSTLSGQSRFSSIPALSREDSVMLAATIAHALQSKADERSAMYPSGAQVHLWQVAPVVIDGRVAGTIAELRRIGNSARTEQAIRELIDDDVRIVYASRGTPWWVSPRGVTVPAPLVRPEVDGRAVLVKASDGGSAFAVQLGVARSPWVIVMYQSQASVLRRPREFLQRILFAGLIVLAVATLGAWLLSRHLTRPLRDVTGAAAALAQGDYARRVSVSGGGREVASLSATFNGMAAAIGDAHATLADRNVELQRANAAKAQFLAMMSHELRTPLNAIGGFTELMELGLRGPVTPEQVEDLGRIRRNKDLLLSIITDILDFTRADAASIAVRLESVEIAPLLVDVADAVRHQMDAKGVRLVRGAVPADAVVRGDREKVQQVMLNLLSNALKFTERGGEVGIETTVADATVRIDVHDTGSGIGAGQLDAIFEPFVQVDASLTRRAGGTGLGLAIARQLATAMGGTVTVRSAVGAGSTFTLSLPHADRRAPTPPHGTREVAGQNA
ncbi:MAG TPA: HAMP domain-containing sensor histidine kinase [Gemmatimonadaceae bacterium]|jgi:signal transduction histidine kinase|nr:HAMP domain-containing sensor histidine kinase [Gemmatimonadaceae bacterium]